MSDGATWSPPIHPVSSDALVFSEVSRAGPAPSSSSGEVTGPQKILVVTVQFTDHPHTTTGKIEETVAALDKYWQDVSYGRISLTTTISTKWYTLRQTYVYYGTNPESSSRKIELITDAVSMTETDFDYKQFSYLIIVHAGDSEGHSMNAADIWDAGTIGRGTVTTSLGSYLLGVSIIAELDPVGAYAHELGHNFGLPDLWDYEISQSACPWCDDFMGEWDLMAHGCWSGNGTTPARLSSWSLLKLGWLEDSALTAIKVGDQTQKQVRPLGSANPSIIKATVTDSTYYLIEARQKTGWDRNLPDEGILIFYADVRKGNGEGPVRYKAPSGGLGKAWETSQFFVDEANQFVVSGVSVDANFNFQVATYGASASQKYDVTVDTPYPDLPVVFDGCEYRTGQGGELVIKEVAFGAHNLTIHAVQVIDQGVRAVFVSWSDHETSNSRTLVVVANTNVTAEYKTQYLLTLVSEVPVNGSGWCDAGSQARITANAVINYGNETRRTFGGWSGDLSETNSSAIVVMDTPKTITAHWMMQYLLTITGPYGSPQGAGWYNTNTVANVSTPTIVEVQLGVRAVFVNWSGNASDTEANLSVLMDRPKSITTNWQLQHSVSVQILDANGQPISAPWPVISFSHAGSQVALNRSGDMWLDVGDYTILDAQWHGINVTATDTKYSTSPNGVWQIQLHVYSATVHVQSIITSLPVKGASVTIRLPDNVILAATTDEQGAAVFPQLPSGLTYRATVTAQYVPQEFAVAVGASNANVTVKMPVLVEIGIIVAVAVVVVLLLLVVRRRGRRAKGTRRRKRTARKLSSAPRKPKPSPLREYFESF